ncbi:MAG: toprim domain-containing protein, partial [Candidatus Omnitrophota bacterium]
FTKNARIVYDADQAGEAATLRGLELLIEEEMNVRIAILPKGADPDSFVRKEGRAGFIKILKESKDLFDYKLDTLTSKFKRHDPHGKMRIVGEMLPTLAKIKNSVLRSGYLRKMSEALEIDEESVREELKKLKPGETRNFSEQKELKRHTHANPAELTLLAIALEDPHTIKKIEEELSISAFSDDSVRKVLNKMRELESENKKIMPSHIINSFDDNRIEGVISEAVGIAETIQDRERVFKDCIHNIKTSNLKDSLKVIQFKIKEAASLSDGAKVDSLLAEYNNLIKGIGKIAINSKL